MRWFEVEFSLVSCRMPRFEWPAERSPERVRPATAPPWCRRSGTHQEAGLIRGVEITTANVHDAAELEAVLPPEPGEVYGDSAFAGARPEGIIRARGGTPCIVHTSIWGGPDALAHLEAHNAEVRRIRPRIEKVFGTVKRCYGLRRMRWRGLAKAGLQVRLAAMAYNLRRSWRLLAPMPA